MSKFLLHDMWPSETSRGYCCHYIAVCYILPFSALICTVHGKLEHAAIQNIAQNFLAQYKELSDTLRPPSASTLLNNFKIMTIFSFTMNQYTPPSLGHKFEDTLREGLWGRGRNRAERKVKLCARSNMWSLNTNNIWTPNVSGQFIILCLNHFNPC